MSSSTSSSSSQTLTLTLIPSQSQSSPLLLIPGLPNDVSALILSLLPIPHQSRLRPVSRLWSRFLSPSSLLPLRRRLRLHRDLLCLFPSDPYSLPPFLLDPLSLLLLPLPALPVSHHLYALSNFSAAFLFPNLYLLGGSLLDAHSYPLHHPLPSSSTFRISLLRPDHRWCRLPDMPSPRGSSACVSLPASNSIIVAGGGSRHSMYPADGTRISSVETFDANSGKWSVSEGMPARRAGCVGFLKGGEFWVMGGYGEYRPVSGVVPADVYCKDVVAMELGSGKWREVGDMWGEGERGRLGKIAVIEGGDGEPSVFMLDRIDIFRYDFALNRWLKESSLRRKLPLDESCCFIAMNGELYVLTSPETPRSPRKRPTLEIQVYNPKKRKWRLLTTNLPIHHPIDFKIAVACKVQL